MPIIQSYLVSTDGGGVYRVDADSFATTLLAEFDVEFTDIDIDPRNDQVWALDDTTLYRLDGIGTATPFAQPAKSLNSGANSLEIDGDGNFYVGYSGLDQVEKLNEFTTLQSFYFSPNDKGLAGDIVVHGQLGKIVTTATIDNRLVSYDLDSGEVLSEVFHGKGDVEGLVYDSANDRFIAFTNFDGVFSIDETSGGGGRIGRLTFSEGGAPTGAAILSVEVAVSDPGGAPVGVPAPGARVRGDGGRDKLKAGDGGNILDGRGGNDVLRGGDGEDRLLGRGGNDRLFGEGDRDVLKGGTGSDRLKGGGGGDRLDGGGGRDRLEGGGGKDRLEGGGGRDRLEGDRGADRLEGEGGRDVFAFRRKDGRDKILDWQDRRDKIEFETGPDRFRDLAIKQKGDDVTIDYRRDGGKITVENADADDFGRGDFIFS